MSSPEVSANLSLSSQVNLTWVIQLCRLDTIQDFLSKLGMKPRILKHDLARWLLRIWFVVLVCPSVKNCIKSQLCVNICNSKFPKNSQRIPKEFQKNSKQIRTLQHYIPNNYKDFPKNSPKIPNKFPKEFQKNSQSFFKKFPKNFPKFSKKFPKNSDSRLQVEILFELVLLYFFHIFQKKSTWLHNN